MEEKDGKCQSILFALLNDAAYKLQSRIICSFSIGSQLSLLKISFK